VEEILIKPLEQNDKEWIKLLLKKSWGSTEIITRGKITNASELPGLKATMSGKNVGLITYKMQENDCEIITLNSFRENKGIGNKLVEETTKIAKGNHCRRIFLITTNDNMNAVKFYQKIGFILTALYPNALIESRKLKPEIPEIGLDGIPLRDEIELEMKLT
jgi:ribosomal protein S18 acetylase RimI-like enzyme